MKRRRGRKGEDPSAMGDILSRYLDQSGLRPRIQEQRTLDAWNDLVGKAIAEVTQPVRFRNRALQVKVTHPVWMQQLQFHKKLIIQKVNEFLGGPFLEELRFVLGEKDEVSSPPMDGTGRNPQRELRKEEQERIAREVSGIRDGEVRDALFQLFAKGLATERKPPPNRREGG
jgi:predicted nucleic acid-binding Zn ribbon protein